MLHHDLTREIAQRARTEEEPRIDVDIRRCGIPSLTRYGVSVENCPDRAAAVVGITDAGQRGVYEVVWSELDVLGVEIASRGYRDRETCGYWR